MNYDGEAYCGISRSTYCEACATYVEDEYIHRYEIEGDHVWICDGCLHDSARIIDCEHDDGTDHLIWAEHAFLTGDGDMVCRVQLLAESTQGRSLNELH